MAVIWWVIAMALTVCWTAYLERRVQHIEALIMAVKELMRFFGSEEAEEDEQVPKL